MEVHLSHISGFQEIVMEREIESSALADHALYELKKQNASERTKSELLKATHLNHGRIQTGAQGGVPPVSRIPPHSLTYSTPIIHCANSSVDP